MCLDIYKHQCANGCWFYKSNRTPGNQICQLICPKNMENVSMFKNQRVRNTFIQHVSQSDSLRYQIPSAISDHIYILYNKTFWKLDMVCASNLRQLPNGNGLRLGLLCTSARCFEVTWPMTILNWCLKKTFPWTPKPWKIKVLNPQYMGHNP